MTAPFVRNAYNYDMNNASKESGLECKDATLTQQQFADEVDINNLVEKFKLTGEVPTVEKLPSYDDYTGIFDFQTAQNAVIAARQQFESLPAKLRTRFNNDPNDYVNFFASQDNLEEAIKLGLVEKPPVAEDAPKTQAKQEVTQKATSKE